MPRVLRRLAARLRPQAATVDTAPPAPSGNRWEPAPLVQAHPRPTPRLQPMPLIEQTTVIPAQYARTPRHDERQGRRLQPVGAPSPTPGRHARPEQPSGRHRAVEASGAHATYRPRTAGGLGA